MVNSIFHPKREFINLRSELVTQID
jgi:hypothetical protein